MGTALFVAVVLAGSLVGLLAVAISDLKERIVPNRLVILIASGGVALRLLSAPELLWVNLLAAAVLFVVLGRLSHHDWIGGGDAKLIAAVTLLVPATDIGRLLFAIAMVGGLMSCTYLAARFMITRTPALRHRLADGGVEMHGVAGLFSHECARIAGGEPMPYALAVVGGVLCLFLGEALICLSAISCSF